MGFVDEHATALADAVEAALAGWVERSVRGRLADVGRPYDPEIADEVAVAAARARDEVGRAIRRLLEQDVDEQATTPLSLLRGAVRFPTGVLRAAGVPPVVRDEVQERLFPEDLYDLTPASFADVDPALAEPALVWGAAKAYVHIQRHGRKQ